MESEQQSLSHESILENPLDQTSSDEQDVLLNNILNEKNKKKRGANIEFQLYGTYDNYDDFVKRVSNGEIKGLNMHFKKKDKDKYRYYCRYLSKGCKAALYLQPTQNSAGLCFVSVEDHSNHPQHERDQIDERITQRIKELESLGVIAQGIIQQLIRDGLQPPSKAKINNIIQSVRKTKKEIAQPSLSDLKRWCEQYNNIPEDENQVFVANFEYESFPIQIFRVFLTTRRLIHFSLDTKYILADATYKLTYGGFPALTGGTTDKSKKFHPFGLALCATENNLDFSFFFKSVEIAAFNVYGFKISPTILVADNAPAITKGFESVFKLEKRVNCWAHVFRNIDKHLVRFSKEFKQKIKSDIYAIQEIFKPEFFQLAIQLFEKKWKLKKSSEIDDFIKYFIDQWGHNNNGWYEGYYGDIPSTTNGLESSHEKIKSALEGKILGLIEFLNECRENLIKFWSQMRSKKIKTINPETNEEIDIDNVNFNHFFKEPIISKSQMLHAFEWNKRSKPIHHIRDNLYMCRTMKMGLSQDKNAKIFLTQLDIMPWDDFDKMIESINSMRLISINKENWKQSRCTCSYWLKNYVCSHV
ncbi:unnamed protein product, partial [Brachionus calyciflorus]